LPAIVPPICARCGTPSVWPVSRCRDCAGRRLSFATARAAVEYDEAVRRIVGGWKERGLRRLAADAAALVVDAVPRPDVELLTFVPADGDRLLKRGHHPAGRLARELGRLWALPDRPLLRRSGTSRRQRGLSLIERRRNVRGAFSATATAPRTVCLVDDVYTSGATVNAAALALRKAGARRVEVVCFARVVR
jgi:predicted amidophosphoribosyltransferase